VKTDLEGYFEVWVKPSQPVPSIGKWVTIELELIHPQREGYPPVMVQGQILIPPSQAQFGVISDIDDTVVQTGATDLLRMARTVFLGNARTRLPFPGVAAFYRALSCGIHTEDTNPLFFVSSSPWNMYDLFEQFFQIEKIPHGHVLFLRDWGISETELLPIRHTGFKTNKICQIMDFYPELPFILIGDSGQEDPEIYSQVVKQYPHRIPAVYIRNVSQSLPRTREVETLAQEILAAGSTLILAENTLPMAEHALENRWITPEAIEQIRLEKELDEAPSGLLEKLLSEEDEEETGTMILDARENGENNPLV
jgi:phosphatidate phosphatase APP1